MIPSGVFTSALTLTGVPCIFYDLLHIWGGRSSAGRALDCGSSGRGFKSRRSPSHFQANPKKFKWIAKQARWNSLYSFGLFWKNL